jgi:hypothetical protein
VVVEELMICFKEIDTEEECLQEQEHTNMEQWLILMRINYDNGER